MHFDLHTHVSLKTMLGGLSNETRKSCWTNIKSQFLDGISGGIIGSQSSLQQMKDGQIEVAVTPLYSLEYAFSTNWLLTDVITEIEHKLSKDYLLSIKNNQLSPYQNLLQELKHIQDAENENMQIVSSLNEIKPGKINLILALEGLHSFQDSYTGDAGVLINNIHANLSDFLSKHRVLYAGLSHLTRNIICTHSYAMKLINDIEFVPQGNGLSVAAKEFIDLCYSNQGYNGKPTFIDLKHMGLTTRIQFYEYRKQKGYENIPIVASHIAVTGCSLQAIPIESAIPSTKYANTIEIKHQRTSCDVIYKYPTSPQLEWVDFNPWSLNLYDEEIDLIISSGGIMGMILDMRVLGSKGDDFGKMDPEGSEYFSQESYDYLKNNKHFNTTPDTSPTLNANDYADINSIVGLKGTMHLFANILHIVKTYHRLHNNLDAWNHICIGSDSDGLIQPIQEYQNASDYTNLRLALLEVFEAERQRDIFSKYFGDMSSQSLIDKIFYSNGYDFIKANL